MLKYIVKNMQFNVKKRKLKINMHILKEFLALCFEMVYNKLREINYRFVGG